MRYFFFDTETTGLPKNWKAPVTDTDNWPRCVEVAVAFSDGKGDLDAHSWYASLIKPDGYEIPEGATRIHGISTELAAKEGSDASEIFNIMHEQIAKSEFVVGHNILFDMNIVNAEFVRLGLPILEKSMMCTMKSGRSYGNKWPNLAELHTYLFGAQFEGAHRAINDLQATVKCFYEMRRRNAFGADHGA